STRLVADLETPVSAYLKLTDGDGGAETGEAGGGDSAASQQPAKAMSFLLESVEGGTQRGRYSIIGCQPDIIWRAFGDRAQINTDAQTHPDAFEDEDLPTLAALRQLLSTSALDLPEHLPPMAAGVFGYMGYDTVRRIEALPNVPPDHLGAPDALMMRPTLMVIFDAIKDDMTITTPVRPTTAHDASAAYELARQRLGEAVAKLRGPLPQSAFVTTSTTTAPPPVSNTSEARYLDMVRQAKELIAAGDIFQVVLAQRFSTPFTLPSFALYRSLRRLNPSPYLFHLDFGDVALVGSSPEILVRVADDRVTIRPIAGTRPRGDDRPSDERFERDLVSDPKERAEHLMLLDLGRNDVGRVCKPGSVHVSEAFTVERYSHVMHIVSNVVGELDRTRCDEVDALMAGFPAGTVSGAPKVRAMEVIDELEATKRGPYAGCVGYFSADGTMDTCIVLRTGIIKDGQLHVQAGAGIVHDSVPANEQQECINKAMAIVRAAEDAVAIASGATPERPAGRQGD
ncbi:MAG: anthranilate synthase component I, partial [Pseudomonadota bacterium]